MPNLTKKRLQDEEDAAAAEEQVALEDPTAANAQPLPEPAPEVPVVEMVKAPLPPTELEQREAAALAQKLNSPRQPTAEEIAVGHRLP